MDRRWIVTAIGGFAVGLSVFFHTLFYSDSWTQRERTRKDLHALVTQNHQAQDQVDSLRARIQALRTRPKVQERVVRHELGYIRPGELIVDLQAEH